MQVRTRNRFYWATRFRVYSNAKGKQPEKKEKKEGQRYCTTQKIDCFFERKKILITIDFQL